MPKPSPSARRRPRQPIVVTVVGTPNLDIAAEVLAPLLLDFLDRHWANEERAEELRRWETDGGK